MMEETAPRRRGRPATGETPKRNIRMGQTWTDGEQLAVQLDMTMTAYVEEAIREKNVRETRKLAKEAQP